MNKNNTNTLTTIQAALQSLRLHGTGQLLTSVTQQYNGVKSPTYTHDTNTLDHTLTAGTVIALLAVALCAGRALTDLGVIKLARAGRIDRPDEAITINRDNP